MGYLLGVDGGGTATKLCAADGAGNVFARHAAGPLNINGQSQEQFRRTIGEILGWLRGAGLRPEECDGVAVGAAGVSNPRTGRLLAEAFAAGGVRAAVHTYSDGETALAAAFPGCHGVILIAGTGSICLGRGENGGSVRAGGYGHLIDDGGGAYAIAIAIFAAVARSEDGRTGPTVLRRLVMEKLGIGSLEEMIGYLYDPARTKKEIASMAVVLDQAAAEGDGAALEIADRSAGELGLLAETVMGRMPEERDIALAGSVLLNNRPIRDRVRRLILARRPDANILCRALDASEGAVRLLLRETAPARAVDTGRGEA